MSVAEDYKSLSDDEISERLSDLLGETEDLEDELRRRIEKAYRLRHPPGHDPKCFSCLLEKEHWEKVMALADHSLKIQTWFDKKSKK